MKYQRYLKIISILGALVVGFWLPLDLIDFNRNILLEVVVEMFVALLSVASLVLHFKDHHKNWKTLKSWINFGVFLDVTALIPWFSLTYWFLDSDKPLLLLINLIIVRHIWRIKSVLDEYDRVGPLAFRMIPLGSAMPLLIHQITCAWIALGSGTTGPNSDRVTEYIKALYWTITTLATVGYGDISAKTSEQMLFASLVMLTGVATFGYVLSNVASLISRADAAREHHMDNLDKVEVFMNSHEIPTEFRHKVRGYYHYLWNKHKGYSDRSIIKDLPTKMQAELFYFINKDIVQKVPLFSGASEELLEDLMRELQPRIFVPFERIFKVDDSGDGIYFIQHGDVDIITREGNIVATLKEGSFFGEMALISERNRNATARAATYCDVYLLPKNSFYRVLNSYPEFREHIEKVIQQRNAPP